MCYPSAKLDEHKINSETKPDDRERIHDWIKLYKEIAVRSGSDKVTTHHYEHLYGQFLGPLRFSEINFLEIGLGCDMGYGPGKSILLWKEFLAKARISVLEYNANCARKFVSQVENLFTGDQRDFAVLNKVGQ